MKNHHLMHDNIGRRSFLQGMTMGAVAAILPSAGRAKEPVMEGFEVVTRKAEASRGWQPVSDRKVRVGIVGYGHCKFGALFYFQQHPNVEIVAVSDLIPERCAGLAKACNCSKTYPSLEELVKDDRIEAVFVATDAPSHARHCMEVLRHGKHVATAVPAVFGSLEAADELFATVKASGLKYMMFETSCFREELYAMRQIYRAGGLGQLVYTEGEYYHYHSEPIPSYKEWRTGLPPLWYPTHATAYHVGIGDGHFTEVSCLGMPSTNPYLQAANNRYQNPFGTEIALFRTSEGGMARMAVSWDTPGYDGEMGRVRGQKGSYYKAFVGRERNRTNTERPPLPPKVEPGSHGGSHGYLMNEFITAILEDRQPLVNIASALNMTVPGIVAHQSALKNGELLKIPTYAWKA